MPRDKPRKQRNAVCMEDGMATWQRLQQWGAAADLLYSPYSPVNQPPSPKEPYTFVVARRIATVMARLNDLCQREWGALLTPRDVLLSLADVMRFGLVSFHNEVMMGQLDGAQVASVMAEYVAHRTAPQVGVVEGLHVITWVSVKLRVEMLLGQLRRRLNEELESSDKENRSPQQVTALRTTLIFLDDFESLYDNALVTFPCVQLMETTNEVAEQLMPILSKQYYQLAEWIGLLESNALLPPITDTRVQSVDSETSSVVLRRTDVSSPLGLIFNQCGKLVDIDSSLRSTSAEGEELHRLLRCTTEGASVVAVNSTTVPSGLRSGTADMLNFLKNATKTNKRIVVKLAGNLFKQPRVQQLAFFLPNQGGEGSSGQRATLVLHRPDRRMAWDLSFTEELLISGVPKRQLTEDAKTFFSGYRGRISLMAVNGVEVGTVAQAEALCTCTETIVLNLLVVTVPLMKQHLGATSGASALALSQKQIEAAKESPLVTERATKQETGRKQKKNPPSLKQEPKKKQLHAEDLDTAADAVYTAEVNEMEELTTESHQLAEEEDVRETYPAVADEDVESMGSGVRQQQQDEQQKLQVKPNEVVQNETNENVQSVSAEDVPAPLVFPNNVTIESLTPVEMIIQRESTEHKWGLLLQTSGGEGAERVVQMMSLPELPSKRDPRLMHPFYKTFQNPPVKTNWCIRSVNGTPATKTRDFLDIIRRSLKLRIKFG